MLDDRCWLLNKEIGKRAKGKEPSKKEKVKRRRN
jgi:hypothetical protein